MEVNNKEAINRMFSTRFNGGGIEEVVEKKKVKKQETRKEREDRLLEVYLRKQLEGADQFEEANHGLVRKNGISAVDFEDVLLKMGCNLEEED